MKEKKRQLGTGLVVSVALLMVICSLGAFSHPAKAALTPQWTAAPAMGNVRSQAVVVQDENGIVYVIGGFDTGAANDVDNVSSYNLATGAWAELTKMPFGSRGAAGCAGEGGKIYVFSGYNGTTGYLANTQIYDTATDSWSAGAPITTRVWEAKAAFLYGKCYVMGGQTPTLSYTTAVQIYDPVADSWSAGLAMPVATKAGALVESMGGLYYIGGETAGGPTAMVNIYYYWGSWNSATSMPNPVVAFAAVEGPEGLIYAFGGGSSVSNTGPGYNSTYYYNPWSDVWLTGPNLTFGARYLGAAKSTDAKIFALGGNNPAMLTRVESLQVMTVSLSLSPTTVGAGRTVVVTGDVQFAFVTPESYGGYAVLVSDSGITFSATEFYNPTGGVFAFELSVLQAAVPGPYHVLIATEVDFLSGGMDLADTKLPLTVTAAQSLDQQIASLQQQLANLQTALANATGDVTDLQDQITALQNQLAELKTAQDDLSGTTDDAKSSASSANMMGIINLVLLIVVIVLLALMFMMGRKKA